MMKNILFYAIPAVLTLAACNKDKPVAPAVPITPAGVITLTLSDLKKATATDGTALGAAGALSATADAEFTIPDKDKSLKAGGNATITVKNAQLPLVKMKGSVVGVVKLTLSGVTEADEVSVRLTEAAKGGAAVRVVPATADVPTTDALENGKLKKPLATTAEKLKGKELYLLFQSGENGFSVADKAVVEITAKDKKFTVTVEGAGTAAKAQNQTAVNKVMVRSDDAKIATIKENTKIQAPAALNTTAEFSVFPKKQSTDEDLNIAITKAKKGDFKAASGGKIGIVQLIFTNAKKLVSSGGSDLVTFTAKIKSVTPSETSKQGKVKLVKDKPAAETELLAANVLKDELKTDGANGDKDKWSDYSSTTGGGGGGTSTNTSKNTWLLFQGAAAGFDESGVIVVEITGTAGTGTDKAERKFTVKISVADVASE